MGKWAIRDSNRHAFHPQIIGGLRVPGISAGPKAGPNLSHGELTCRLIERWDELDDGVKVEIAELLSHD